ncbi:glutamate 5-kinase [Campylobacter sp. Marseille-Q3452]|uniref:Glutamate 5-kinase n=1 Tax=Campylobacter massiliensis TaxID=2762557 RepID=A0A842J992_9BACT|nr:glutamate 5-kinase [Campylobacter massiliensis]MBC2882579.1 glutamate 5-kinase [Campylobacter massiliensis]
MDRKELLGGVKRIVVKVGTSTLANADGSLNEDKIKQIVANLSELNENAEVVFVTSGAVGAGMGQMKLAHKPKSIVEKQALAAIGQVSLIHLYQILFWAHGKTIAQLLLTKDDFSDRRRYLNMRSVLRSLLAKKIIPVINENDPVVGEGIKGVKVGDNDTLSALVAGLIEADLLVILTDIDGLYDKNPSVFADAKFINLVENLDDGIRAAAGAEGSKFGTGGMRTKITAAEMTTKNGTHLIIANGSDPRNIVRAAQGSEVGTLFLAGKNRINSRKYWLAYSAADNGSVAIDAGAAKALKEGKSLLAVGIAEVVGEFERGETLAIKDANGLALARGITNYSSAELALIKGRKSEEIEAVLGYKYEDEALHIDNIALI